MSTLIKKRESYNPLLWLPKTINLDFKIFEHYTLVNSNIIFYKNTFSDFKLEASIELNGIDLETLSFQISLDDKPFYEIDINKKFINDELISISIPDEVLKVNILSKVKILPKKNSSLEGLYESNQMFCTQCEPEGFRKITWFTDRPDCLAVFKVRVEAPLLFSSLLSNGNLINKGVINDDNNNPIRHFKTWEDPFPKPSYLFALVVGCLELSSSTFITASKKIINLEIYTEIGNKHLTSHAMISLKKAMEWDEKKYGLEYDLKCFMIVAVSHFNMGAMENKGLNIFNSKFILADPSTASDADLNNIEAIVAHEYFHNWTGNRVTCRDWFQLTLKEGLTVFRDQEFTADMNNKGVKRIQDVMLLRSIQFPEDAGSNSHAIRPDEYIEINNFYTPTVYEKGAEVIRMIYNYLGEDLYRKGIDKYFQLFDGKAVTCENFLEALQIGSNLDLSLFKKWYSQSGTPELTIKRVIDINKITLNIMQSVNKKISDLPIPIKISLINQNGHLVKFSINKLDLKYEHVFLFTKNTSKIILTGFKGSVTPSILRGFSAPVKLNTDLSISEYIHILSHDNDAFNKWDAIQNLYLSCAFNKENITLITNVLGKFLLENINNPSLISCLLELPSRTAFENLYEFSDPIEIYTLRLDIMKKISLNLQEIFEKIAHNLINNNIENSEKKGERALLNKILYFLILIKSKIATQLAQNISISDNMTLCLIGLNSLSLNNDQNSLKYLNKFYLKWINNSLVLEKWFEMMSRLNLKDEGINFVKNLLNHEAFDFKNPNKLRSVLGTFQRDNILLFHANDSSGYEFLAEQVALIDDKNPQAAARLVLPLTRFANYKQSRKNKMKEALSQISQNKTLSNDLSEIITKALQ